MKNQNFKYLLCIIFLFIFSCDDDNGNPVAPEIDCNDVSGGTAYLDDCGDCVGGATGAEECEVDCNGLFEGDEGYNADAIEDCLGVCDGAAVVDECDVCGGDGATEGFDCDGNALVEYSEINSIFTSNCTGCHGNSGGLSLTSYTNLMDGGNSGSVIIPGDHMNSLLWQKVNSGSMPLGCGSSCLTSEVDLIALWIDQGALNQ